MEIINLKTESETNPSDYAFKQPKNEITDIKSAAKNQNRVNIFVDGEFCFSLDIAQVVDYHLKIGKILEPSEIEDLKRASAYGKLYASTLEWVLMRPRSIKETRDHLKNKLFKLKVDNKRRAENRERVKSDPEFKKLARDYKIRTREREVYTEEDIEKVISRLIEKDYLDDRKFATWFIENRFSSKGVSEIRLRQELVKKGIDSKLVEELLADSPRDEAEEIKKVIKKKGKRMDEQKLLAHLMRHGFSIDLSRELVSEFYSNPDEF